MSNNPSIITILENIEQSAEHIREESIEMGNVVAAEEADQIIVRTQRLCDWLESERHLYD